VNRISIIIPTHNGLELLRGCIASIRLRTKQPYEMIVVDNGSTDGTLAWCDQERIPCLSLPVNAGYPAACNKGLQLASGDTFVLLKPSIVVTPNWLSVLIKALDSQADVGIVGPAFSHGSGSQQAEVTYRTPDEFQEIAAKTNRPNPAKWKSVDRVVGSCMVFSRSLLDSIGMLDERFSPGFYEDDDYCYRAKLRGYKVLVCHDCLMDSEGSVGFKQQGLQKRKSLMERNRQLFVDKWQIDPLAFV
jgi:GT2 family glycosyltransferase